MFIEYFVISITALFVSSLTLFSGFGLGTILMPAFALFFPVPVAIAATAVVHLANNVFKIVLVGRKADWRVVFRFALPAALSAILGAALLGWLSSAPLVATYRIGTRMYEIMVVKLVIGALIVLFAMFDLLPLLRKLSFDRRYLPFGGLLSGFFGGLSGNQGAFRATFLIKTGLTTEAFIGTSAVSASIVDVVRLFVYGAGFYTTNFGSIGKDVWTLVAVATASAFIGAFAGSRVIKKVTITAIQYIVGVMLIVVGVGLASGLL